MCEHKPWFTIVRVCKTKFRLWKNVQNNLKYVRGQNQVGLQIKNSGLHLLFSWLLWRKVNNVWHRIDAASPVFEKPIRRWITLCSQRYLCAVHGFYENIDIMRLSFEYQIRTAHSALPLKGKRDSFHLFLISTMIISIVSPIRDGLAHKANT